MKTGASISNNLIGIAGVHWVVFDLTLRGLVALPTVRNTAGFDIIVGTPDGSSHAFLQIKTSMKKKTSFWPVSSPEKFSKGSHIFFVFLRYLENEKKYEAFLEDSVIVIQQVKGNLEDYQKRGKKNSPIGLYPKSSQRLTSFG